MTKKENVSPIRKQYLTIKRQYPETILFFRLGDFYETFDHDAETISKELDIVLTSRNVGKGTRVPMAGIPHHAVESYLSRLIVKGYHVAICDQVGDQPINGLMPRNVVRIVTPGTVIEPGLLPGDANNYLVAVIVQEKRAGIAYADITTGEFAATEIHGQDVWGLVRAELIRINPAEVLLPDNILENSKKNISSHQTVIPAWKFEYARCESALKETFRVASLDGFGVKGKPLAVRVSGALIEYLKETRQSAIKLLTGLSTYHLSEFMTLDAPTRRNLELTETIREGQENGSLLGLLDRTVTPLGKRLLRQWVSKPLLDVMKITERQDGVDYFFKHGLFRKEMRESLRHLNDLERLANRVHSGVAQPRDLVAMRKTLQALPKITSLLEDIPNLIHIKEDFSLCGEELALLESGISDDPPAVLGNMGIIRPNFSEELDQTCESSRHAREWIGNLEAVEKERTGIKTLKVGFNKIYGYYIEVTKPNASLVPNEYIRKQTLVNAERYITPELKEYETLVLNAEERIKEIERRVFYEICNTLSKSVKKFLRTSRALAKLDVLSSLAETAALNGYVRPQVVEEDILEIHLGRHPVVEHTLEGERFVPNDAIFEEGERIRIITGPNMSGKSTFLRQVALIVLMSQMGSYIPAKSARIGLVDRIFTRIGAQDEIHAGQSTFMVEMLETANILHNASPRSLLILDEIGRGTSTYDGVSIAWAVVEYIHNHPKLRSKTLFATHYHELTQLTAILPGVRNYNVAVSEADGKVVFLRTIIPGGADKSYGIHVAQLAGLPRPVIQRADEILKQLEASSGRAININPHVTQQMKLFPETNPLIDELKELDLNSLTPIEAINRLYEWKKKFSHDE
ncbi:MAG TPA: DNA mismatch repair protein MutS [Anaerolineae bacterium]|nr:DNA mismatch repair protein MutS [Anaerolineae bacterium]